MSDRDALPICRVLLFTSPKAGSGGGRDQLDQLEAMLKSRSVACQRIDDPAVLSDQTRVREDGLAVVAAGGDGTLSLVASCVADGTPIVPMPMGTENLLARHFGYGGSADGVLSILERGETFRMDAGRANGRLFLVMVTAGFDAEVVRALHLRRRGHIRRFSYAGPIWRAIRKYRFPCITASMTSIGKPDAETELVVAGGDGSSDEGCWMMAFNLPCYAASLGIEPGARADDGKLNLLRFREGSVTSGLRYLWGIQRGTHLADTGVQRQFVERSVWTSASRVPYQLDGDYAGRLPVTIEVLPGFVTLLCPPDWQTASRWRDFGDE